MVRDRKARRVLRGGLHVMIGVADDVVVAEGTMASARGRKQIGALVERRERASMEVKRPAVMVGQR